MWKPIAMALATLLLLISGGAATGQDSALPPPAAKVTYEDLAKLGADARGVYDLRDNYFVYCEALESIARRAKSWEGAEIEFEVAVYIVTKQEVYVKVPTAEITIVQIIPRDFYAQRFEPTQLHEPLTLSHYLDYFGPSKTSRFIKYFGPPSTVRYNLLARPASLVIGKDVSLEFARGLRGGDRFYVKGKILGADMKLPASFVGETVVFITDVSAIEDELLIRRAPRSAY
jgi:hypothetical protein